MKTLERTNMGYVLPPPPNPNVFIDELDAAGPIAKKGNTTIDFDSVSQVVGVNGLDAIEVINTFSELWDIVKETLEPNIDKRVNFYEYISKHTVDNDQNPLEILGKKKYENGLSDTISEILQEKSSNYSIHICSPDIPVDNPNWYDIQIRPHGRRPEKLFEISTVYRKPEKDKVEKFVKNREDRIRDIFKILS